jgi:fructose-1,6-bisphosphatase/inositol monophosphatase family enzyme
MQLNAWDVAAAGLIALEAGVTVTNMQGEPDFMRPPFSVAAANPGLHALLMAEIEKVEKNTL